MATTPRLCLTPLGGVGEVRGATWLVREGRGKGALIDFGSDIARSGSLLGSRLRLREGRGIDDALDLGLLPAYGGLYRDDLIVDEDALEDAREISVRDLFNTHHHLDHSGEAYALDPAIRVHCTVVTAALHLAATIATGGLRGEITHYTERSPHPTEAGLIHRPRGAELEGRTVLTVDGAPSRALRQRWREVGPDDGLGESDMEIGGIPFRAHPVDHSVYGASALELLAQGGTVMHMGDLRRHGRFGRRTEKLVAHLEDSRPRVLILEGTRVGRPDDPIVTEAGCARRIEEAVRGAGRRLVVASVGPNHLERHEAFLRAAQGARRTLVVSARTMLRLEAVTAADASLGVAGHPALALFDPPASSRPKWHKEMRERLDDRLVTPEMLRKDPSRYVLAHGFTSMMDWLSVEPQKAMFVFSASAAYSDQARGEHRALGLWTQMFDMRTVGIAFHGQRSEYDPLFNPSGHLHQKDVEEILQRVRPELLIPVHTTAPEMFREFAPSGTRVLLPENGRTIKL